MKRIAVLFLIVFAASALLAQEGRPAAQELQAVPPHPGIVACPFPYSQTFTNGPTPTPIKAEFPAALQAAIVGSVWNQTVADKHFGHTFSFPSQRECCLMTSGKLEVTIKALQSAPPNDSASGNDAVHAIANGAVFQSQQPWLTSGVTAGAVKTVWFTLTAAQLANGKISFYVQDDSAVLSARLTVSGCCIRKP
ncbi:MAG TPA: hypothetical protein VGQ36_02815 [Thermoanaerobaculia bacterium]|jgi:hypothetical protein|nr:hypothetical protein [Thermoanaerobaculia bacterium]